MPSITLPVLQVVGPMGNRSYLDAMLPPDWSISSIDMDVGNTPVDPRCVSCCFTCLLVIGIPPSRLIHNSV